MCFFDNFYKKYYFYLFLIERNLKKDDPHTINLHFNLLKPKSVHPVLENNEEWI